MTICAGIEHCILDELPFKFRMENNKDKIVEVFVNLVKFVYLFLVSSLESTRSAPGEVRRRNSMGMCVGRICWIGAFPVERG